VNVIWLSYTEAPAKGYWCYGFLEEVFDNTGTADIYHGLKINDVPDGEGAVVVLPAEYHVDHVDRLNAELATLPWVRLILASDERGIFPVEKLAPHPALELWVMTPHFEKHTYPEGTRFLGEYYPQDARKLIKDGYGCNFQRPHAFAFSGQITHQRRHELVQSLENVEGYLFKTAGFTQGLGRSDYYELLVNAETVPAPSGPVTLDSFRAFEALEAGAVPILDLKCPVECDGYLYWESILGDHPLPTVEHWDDAVKIIETVNERSPLYRQYINSWWQLHKRSIRNDLTDRPSGDVTVLIPTSPIPSNPNTRIIEDTIASVRFHLPDADIIIMFDGVRDQQAGREDAYRQYVDLMLYKCAFEYTNVYPLVSLDHQHQANMTRRALSYVTTPLVLFVEHDTPLVTDHDFMWDDTLDMMKNGGLDQLRFHYEGRIHPEHEHLMLDSEPVLIDGVPVRRTIQWSQRPHLAGADYYRRILEEHFPDTGRTMIEDRMHSVCQVEPWESNRLGVFHPEGTIVRSMHTDGRGADSKFEMKYE
jgi:hypothetical protein